MAMSQRVNQRIINIKVFSNKNVVLSLYWEKTKFKDQQCVTTIYQHIMKTWYGRIESKQSDCINKLINLNDFNSVRKIYMIRTHKSKPNFLLYIWNASKNMMIQNGYSCEMNGKLYQEKDKKKGR